MGWWTDGDGPVCGHCGTQLPASYEGKVHIQATPSGAVIVGEEAGIHRCATVTRDDELAALIAAQESFDRWEPQNFTPEEIEEVKRLCAEQGVIFTPATETPNTRSPDA